MDLPDMSGPFVPGGGFGGIDPGGGGWSDGGKYRNADQRGRIERGPHYQSHYQEFPAAQGGTVSFPSVDIPVPTPAAVEYVQVRCVVRAEYVIALHEALVRAVPEGIDVETQPARYDFLERGFVAYGDTTSFRT